MLPGFRFLVAAVVLSISVFVFGLGAAALLRSAHDEVASLPTRRAPPQAGFLQSYEAAPTLGMLSLNPPASEPASDAATGDLQPAASTALSETDAAATPADVMTAEAPPREPAAAAEPAEPQRPISAPVAIQGTLPPSLPVASSFADTREAAAVFPAPVTTLTKADLSFASSRVALLPGSTASIDAKAASVAKAQKLKAQRIATRRRIAARRAQAVVDQRAAAAAQRKAQQPFDPFALQPQLQPQNR